jgi:hypothetical protein
MPKNAPLKSGGNINIQITSGASTVFTIKKINKLNSGDLVKSLSMPSCLACAIIGQKSSYTKVREVAKQKIMYNSNAPM